MNEPVFPKDPGGEELQVHGRVEPGELAAGDGEAPLLHHKGRQSLADSFSTELSLLELVPR